MQVYSRTTRCGTARSKRFRDKRRESIAPVEASEKSCNEDQPTAVDKAGQAPTARNMKARGKREARRPWLMSVARARPEGPRYMHSNSALSGLPVKVESEPGATHSASLVLCPWLSYSAPLALKERGPTDRLCVSTLPRLGLAAESNRNGSFPDRAISRRTFFLRLR